MPRRWAHTWRRSAPARRSCWTLRAILFPFPKYDLEGRGPKASPPLPAICPGCKRTSNFVQSWITNRPMRKNLYRPGTFPVSHPGSLPHETVGAANDRAEIETGVAQSGRQYGRQNQTGPRAQTKLAIGTSWWMELFSSEITAIFDSVHNSGKGDAVIFWEAILGRQIWLRPPRIWSSKRDS